MGQKWRKSAVFIMQIAGVLFLLGLPSSAVRGQGLPFEDKARYEKALEQKVDEVLVRLLGPNQAKVVVEATMDFTRTEKLEVNSEAPAAKADPFKWQAAGGDAAASEYLMPGYPIMGQSQPENRTYNKQLSFPSVFVKRLNVTVLVNKSVEEAAAQNIRQVVSDLLLADQRRGDVISVIRAPFAPLWKTIWYTPETLSLVLKYIILSVMGIVGIIVVAVGFLKLADAMSTMAKVQQSHQITMDLGAGAGGGEGGGDKPALPKLPGSGGGGGGGEASQDVTTAEGAETVFLVRENQVPFLVNIMLKEEPENVALVVNHLEPAVRTAFLKALPQDFSAEVMAHMAKVRFMEPEVIVTLKDELERRLSGAIGGVHKVLESFSTLALRAKREMLLKLEEKHPDLAREVKAHVLLPEDLLKLEDREISLLVSAVKMENWSAAVWDMPQPLKERVRAQMAEKAWKMIEESSKFGMPSREVTETAVESVMDAAEKLIAEGRISNPLEKTMPLMVEGGAAA